MASIIRRNAEGKVTLHTPTRHEVRADVFVRLVIDNYEVCLDNEDIRRINEAHAKVLRQMRASA